MGKSFLFRARFSLSLVIVGIALAIAIAAAQIRPTVSFRNRNDVGRFSWCMTTGAFPPDRIFLP